MNSISDHWVKAMRSGDFEAAWRQTDRIEISRRWRQQYPGFQRSPDELVWDGSPLGNRRVLISCEHGLGDAVQFIRYVTRVQSVAAEVQVRVQPALHELFAAVPGIDRLENAWSSAPPPADHDVVVECMELPYVFRDTVQSLPHKTPYFSVERIKQYATIPIIPDGPDLRVGLAWASSDWDISRSIPLAAFTGILATPHALFYSFQQGSAANDPLLGRLPITVLSPFTARVINAASALIQMDLVITVDTFFAHLAGALGIPTRLLLQPMPDWRWMERGTSTPWYPRTRLVRRRIRDAWPEVLEGLSVEISAIAAKKRACFRSG